MRQYFWLLFTLFFATTFMVVVSIAPPKGLPPRLQTPGDRVVIAAPLQTLMVGGDRYLAANLEAIRIAATALDSPPGDNKAAASYLIRAHRTVAQLNPCHEDNYYLGNALLSWAGAEDEGLDLLRRAMECRYWDELPAFFYGFNQYFFRHNTSEAKRALELAAQRSPDNAAALRKLAIMIAAGEIKDDRMALDYLKNQRDQAKDKKLHQMLDKRVVRLEGLITLREAQKRFEDRYGRPLKMPGELLSSGLLKQYPNDPLGLGYEFQAGKFQLRKLKILGMENSK